MRRDGRLTARRARFFDLARAYASVQTKATEFGCWSGGGRARLRRVKSYDDIRVGYSTFSREERADSSDCGLRQNVDQILARWSRRLAMVRMFHCWGRSVGFSSLRAMGVETGAPSRGRIEKTDARDWA